MGFLLLLHQILSFVLLMADNKAKYMEGVGWRCDTDTARHHRESLWDYKGRAIYHITLATEGRQPIFGTLTGNSAEEAFVVYSRLGEYVDRTLRGLPAFYARKGVRIKVIAVRVMPDHLHVVIQVLEPMPKSIGEVVRSFKSACTSWFKREYFCSGNNAREVQELDGEVKRQGEEMREYFCSGNNAREVQELEGVVKRQGGEVREYFCSGNNARGVQELDGEMDRQTRGVQEMEGRLVQFCRIFATCGSIWEYMPAGYHERILHCDGQLDRMIRYVKDNPRRLWLKRHNPQLFRLRNDLLWVFTDVDGNSRTWKFRALGNMFQLDFPQKQHIQCSRSVTVKELELKYQMWLSNALHGMVSITSAISEGEKIVVKRLRDAGMPLIVMLKDGFPPAGSIHERYFKPGGVYFDACAAGRLLLIEPYCEVLDDPIIMEAVFRKSPMATHGSMRYHFLALNKVGEVICGDSLS